MTECVHCGLRVSDHIAGAHGAELGRVVARSLTLGVNPLHAAVERMRVPNSNKGGGAVRYAEEGEPKPDAEPKPDEGSGESGGTEGGEDKGAE